MADQVLIVDDDQAVLTMLYKVISSNGLQADTAESGEACLELLKQKQYDLLLLDINLSGMDGFQVIQHIRRQGSKIPIVIVSGRKEDYDTLYGLDIGADDYITKPLNPVTLAAKVKALIRRSRGNLPGAEQVLTAGPFQYNTSTLRFYKDGVEIPLSSKENAMIKLFMDNVNHIFSKDMIYDLVWGSAIIDENAIMVYINRLRRGIPLQADPTVKYALQDFTLRRILHRHLKTQSPYNTYIHRGLPPSPICMPGKNAIDAVLDFEQHDYIFFCARPTFDGYHNFARTLREHNANARAYAAELNRRKIR